MNFFVKITIENNGITLIKYAGLSGEKTTVKAFGNGKEKNFKPRKIHGYKTLNGAKKFIENNWRYESTSCNVTYEIVKEMTL